MAENGESATKCDGCRFDTILGCTSDQPCTGKTAPVIPGCPSRKTKVDNDCYAVCHGARPCLRKQDAAPTDSNIINAPFTDDQVASLNAYQRSGAGHPFTCGNDCCPGAREGERVLEADRYAWHCPRCSYLQTWAHRFMANWSWKKYAAINAAVEKFTSKTEVSDTDVAIMEHEITEAENKVWGP